MSQVLGRRSLCVVVEKRVLTRARYFSTCQGRSLERKDYSGQLIRQKMLTGEGFYRDSLVKQL